MLGGRFLQLPFGAQRLGKQEMSACRCGRSGIFRNDSPPGGLILGIGKELAQHGVPCIERRATKRQPARRLLQQPH